MQFIIRSDCIYLIWILFWNQNIMIIFEFSKRITGRAEGDLPTASHSQATQAHLRTQIASENEPKFIRINTEQID